VDAIRQAVKEMLSIVERLTKQYPKKRFTLDGRLVGDIGEILVENDYRLNLFEDLAKHHDATADDGRLVQIKATMKESLTFPADHVPVYYLGIKIHKDGSYTEVFNGPGAIAWEAVKNRKSKPKNNQYSISVKTLARLDERVEERDRIPKRE